VNYMDVTLGVPSGCQHLLKDLTPEQRRAVETPSQTVCVLAAAGAGKTGVLTRRIAYRALTGSAKAEHVLAITFTRKAAGELRERLSSLGLGSAVTAGTFHSAALSQLRRWWADRRAPAPAVLERKGRLLGELVAERPGLADASVADLASQIEWAKARLIAPGSFAVSARSSYRALPADADAIATLYARYEDEKRRRRLVDFDDLLARYADALCSDDRFAAAQRWKWRHIFVDELQDVNPLQCRLLDVLLGQNADLFVVGDPHQAIYGWNGADPSFLNDFPSRWPEAEVIRLEDNHRSSPQVVAAASAVLGRQSSGQVRSTQPDGPRPVLRSFANEEAEAAGVAERMAAAHARGLPWAEMAALARTNAQLVAISTALRRAGVPFHAVPSGEGSDDLTVEVALEPPADIGRTGLAKIAPATRQGLGEVTVSSFHRAKGLQWGAVWVCGLEAGMVPIAYATSSAAMAEERRLLYVALSRAERELYCSWARERRAANGISLRREPSPWLRALAAHCAGPGGEAGDGPCDGDAAEGYPEGAARSSRNGRRQGLRSSNGADRAGQPGDTDAALVDFLAAARKRLSRANARPGRGRRARLGPDQAGARAAENPQEDDLLEAPADPRVAQAAQTADNLRQWRRRLARASGVPPHVLLHDSTVDLIAARQPASADELLAVPGVGPVKVARYGPAILEVVLGSTAAGRGCPPG